MLAHRLLVRLVHPPCVPESAYDDANAAEERHACVVLLDKKKPGFCLPQEEGVCISKGDLD